MKNDNIFRICSPAAFNVCINYKMPQGAGGKNLLAEHCEKKGFSYRDTRIFGSTQHTRGYNPTVKGYGGYVPRESREWHTTAANNRKQRSRDIKEAKRIVGDLVSPLASGKNARSATIKAAKKNPILKRKKKLMGKVQRGLKQRDVKYLKKLAENM